MLHAPKVHHHSFIYQFRVYAHTRRLSASVASTGVGRLLAEGLRQNESLYWTSLGDSHLCYSSY